MEEEMPSLLQIFWNTLLILSLMNEIGHPSAVLDGTEDFCIGIYVRQEWTGGGQSIFLLVS